MSGTLYLKFQKGEIKKVKKVFHVLSTDGANLIPPNDPDLPEDSKNRGLYVEFKRNTMYLEYAIWDRFSSGWATLLGQELSKHFKLEKAGWDSVGWCKDIAEFENIKEPFSLSWFATEQNEIRKRLQQKTKEMIEKALTK